MNSRRQAWGNLALVAPVAVVGVAILTGLIVWLGPEPVVPTESKLLWPEALNQALIEPRDRWVLLAWWLFTVVLALGMATAARRGWKVRGTRAAKVWTWLALILTLVAVGVILASVTWNVDDAFDQWSGVGLVQLAVGFGLSAACFALWRATRPIALGISLVLVGIVIALVGPAWLQVPNHIHDVYDFRFTADELSAVAAGHLPLVDYFPQYTILLGYPIAPLLAWIPQSTVGIVLAWLLFLQVVAVTIAIVFPVLLGGWRLAAPALLFVLSMAFLLQDNGFSTPTQYFAGIPLRVVLPAIALLLAFLMLRRPESSDRSDKWCTLGVGLVAGLTGLNNADFGLPVVLVIAIVMAVALPWNRRLLVRLVLFLGGAASVFVLYTLGLAVVGARVDWLSWLSFQRAFATEGYFQIAMPGFGLHVAVVALFVSASVIGFLLIRGSSSVTSTFSRQQGLALALTGGWSLLTLAYFSGRSLVPTLIGGFAFQIGLVTAALLPLIRATLVGSSLGLSRTPTRSGIAVASSLLVLSTCGGLVMYSLTPTQWVKNDEKISTGNGGESVLNTESVLALVNDPNNTDMFLAAGRHELDQLLQAANVVELTTGIPSALKTNSPGNFASFRFAVEQQCAAPSPSGSQLTLLLASTVDYLKRDPSCAEKYDFNRVQWVTSLGVEFAVLPSIAK